MTDDSPPPPYHTPSTRTPSHPPPKGEEDGPAPRPRSGPWVTAVDAETARQEAEAAQRAALYEPPGRLSLTQAPVVKILIIVTAAIEIVLFLADGAADGALSVVRERVFQMFAFSPLASYLALEGEIGIQGLYGVLGHMFLHGGVLHLGLNMFALALFGPPLERVLGGARLLTLYVIAGLGGALGHGLWQYGVTLLSPESGPWPLAVQLVGASGAISGLIGAELTRRAMTLSDLPPSQRLASPLGFLARASSGFVLINIALSALGTAISGSAHLGGFFAGMAAMALLRRRPGQYGMG